MSEEGKSATNRRLSDTKFALDAARKIAIIRRAWTMQEWTHTHQLQQAVAEQGLNLSVTQQRSLYTDVFNNSVLPQLKSLPGFPCHVAGSTTTDMPTLDDVLHKDKVTAKHNDNEQDHGTTNIEGGNKDKGKGKMSRAIYPKGI